MKYPAYPKYKDSGIEWLGDVPEHWEIYALRRKLKNGTDGIKIGPFGSQLKLEIMQDEGFKVYGQENVIGNNFEVGKRFIGKEKYAELYVYSIKPGDILISMMGTSGRCQIVPEGIKEGIMDSHLLRLRVREDEIKSEFISLLIDKSQYIRHQINIAGKGAIMHGLNSGLIKDICIATPTIAEQVKILSFINRETAKIDVLIAKKQRLIELLKEKRTALISHAVTKGLDPDAPMEDSGVEWLDSYPIGWIGGQLKRFVIIKITDGPHETPEFVNEGIEFISAEAIQNGRINFEARRGFISEVLHKQYCKKCSPKKDDIFLCKSGATTGKVAIVEDQREFSVWSPLAQIRTEQQKVKPKFLYLSLQSDYIQNQIRRTWSAGTQPNISMSAIERLFVVAPKISDQEAITTYLDGETAKIDALVAKTKEVIEKLKEYRTALISAAVTGKIDVREEAA